MPSARTGFYLPLAYRLFFLVIEPISALAGAYFCHLRQGEYLALLHASSAPPSGDVPLATSAALSQLANMYLFFALNEALVLRSTWDMRVWRAVLLGLLLGDIGHLYSHWALGSRIYWDVAGWNAADWGNVPFVYLGATMRICFLLGVGLGERKGAKKEE